MREPEPLFGPDDSTIEGFGETGGLFFGKAWDEQRDNSDVDAFAARPAEEADQEDALRRSFARRPIRMWLAGLVLIAVAASLMSIALRDNRFEEPPIDEAGVSFDGLLVAPGELRTYEPKGAVAPDRVSTGLEDWFGRVGEGGEMLTLAEPDPNLPSGVVASALIWGNRLHVLFVGLAGFVDDRCAVATLVASDLETLDVAATGDGCGDRFAATGDRSACIGSDAILLEVWPPAALDPSVATGVPSVPVAQIRVRVEQLGRGTWAESSIRGVLDLQEVAPIDVGTLGGPPGSVAEFTVQGVTGSCELRDRNLVEIKTL